MRVNQDGDPAFHDEIWRTNATKHGNTELRLEEIE